MKDFLREWGRVIVFIFSFVVLAVVGGVTIWVSFGAGVIADKPGVVPWLGVWVTFVALLLALVGGSITFHELQPRPQVRVAVQRVVTDYSGYLKQYAIELMLFNPGNAIALSYSIRFALPDSHEFSVDDQYNIINQWEFTSPTTLTYSGLDQAPIFPGQRNLLSGLLVDVDTSQEEQLDFEMEYSVEGRSIRGPRSGVLTILIPGDMGLDF